MKDAPVKKFRIGRLSASIWKNESQNGGDWHSVTLERTYKDADDNLQNSNSLNHSDLQNARKLLDRCDDWIAEQ